MVSFYIVHSNVSSESSLRLLERPQAPERAFRRWAFPDRTSRVRVAPRADAVPALRSNSFAQ